MEDLQQKKKVVPLRKCTSMYKLVIPREVERKIRYLCNKISQVEWSGTLFYTHSGSYEEGTLEIKCVDIFPMDIGSQAYTEFDMSPDVIAYMTDHPELLDCQMGLIHSHNNMATFISGTDAGTLQEEGNDRNHFVSLIVNNEGTYTAAITRKVTEKNTVNTTYTYKTFDDVEKTGTKSTITEEEVIEYNMLNIIKEGEETNSFLELDGILKAIREKKDKMVVTKTSFSTDYYPRGLSSIPPVYKGNSKEVSKIARQSSLFDDDLETWPNIKKDEYSEDDITVEASTVKSIVLQLITGSIAIADVSRIDPVKWAGQMVRLFDKRFENDMSLFGYWAEIMVEFVVNNFIPKKYMAYQEFYTSKLSMEVYKALDELPQNKYIKLIQDTLMLWIQ